MGEFTLIEVIEMTLVNSLIAERHSQAFAKTLHKTFDAPATSKGWLVRNAHWNAARLYEGYADNAWACAAQAA